MSKTQSNRSVPKVVPQPAVTVQKPKELTEIQRVMTDLCAEMILRGGPATPIDNLLTACIGFEYRNALNVGKQENIDEYVDDRSVDWRNQLEASWPKRGTPPEPDRSTVTKRIRDDMRGRLGAHLDEFLRRATPEEVLLMTEVMQHWESEGPIFPSENLDEPEVILGAAFEYVFGERVNRYIRVPHEHWRLVQEYLRLLEGRGKEAA